MKSIRLLVADHCNLNCPFCHNEGQSLRPKGYDMSLDALEKTLECAKQDYSGKLKIQVTGGEPYEHAQSAAMMEILARNRESYSDLVITTNGTHPEGICSTLDAFGRQGNRKVRFNLSLPALPSEKEAYLEAVGVAGETGNTYRDKVLRSIETLKGDRARVKINAALTRSFAYEHLEEYIENCSGNSFSLRFIELESPGSLGRGEVTVAAQNRARFCARERVGYSEFESAMRGLGYVLRTPEDRRVKVFSPVSDCRADVSFVRCCPQVCSSCASENACVRLAAAGGGATKVSSCVKDLDGARPVGSDDLRGRIIAAGKDLDARIGGAQNGALLARNESAVLAFFSLDLVHSGAVKNRNLRAWQVILPSVIDAAKTELWKEGLLLWRVIGDELVFYYHVTDLEGLVDKVACVHRAVAKLNESIMERTLVEDIDLDGLYLDLGVRASAWIAPVFFPTGASFFSEARYNLGYMFAMQENVRYGLFNLEFVGPDFDAGFLISKCAGAGEMVLAYELAELVLEANAKHSRVALDSIENCPDLTRKGIWPDSRYPALFHLGEKDIVRSGLSVLPSPSVGTLSLQDDTRFSFDRRYMADKLQDIKHLVASSNVNLNLVQPLKPFDVHLVGICYHVGADGDFEVLMFQRRELPKHNSLGGRWEFGYCRYDNARKYGPEGASAPDTKLSEAVEKQYEAQYGLKVSANDEPVLTYAYDRKPYETVVGMRFLCEVSDGCFEGYDVDNPTFEGECGSNFCAAKKISQKAYREMRSSGSRFCDDAQVEAVFEEILPKLVGRRAQGRPSEQLQPSPAEVEKLVIWDFNGTVLDDVSAEVAAINEMLANRGLKEFGSDEDYREAFRFPVGIFYSSIGLGDDDFEALSAERAEAYSRHSATASMRSGIKPLIDELALRGATQVLLSATEAGVLEEQVDSLGIGSLFIEVVGSSESAGHGKGGLLADLLKRYAGGEAIVVGDTVSDFEISRDASVECVLVEGGHESSSRLYGCGCHVARDASELGVMLLEWAERSEGLSAQR